MFCHKVTLVKLLESVTTPRILTWELVLLTEGKQTFYFCRGKQKTNLYLLKQVSLDDNRKTKATLDLGVHGF